MPKRPLPAVLLLLALASTAAADEDHSVFRVFVGDHAAPRVTAFDLAAPDKRWQFDITGQAKLYPLAGGAVVAAVQSDDDAVQFLHSGITLENHGDHSDLEIGEPAPLGAPLTGPRPFHVVSHDGQSFINFDRGGYAAILDEAELTEGRIDPVQFQQARAHHGFVAALGEVLVSTVAAEAEEAPRLGLQAFSADGTPAGDLAPCTGIHGEAFSGAYLAAGCKEGVLTARAEGGSVAYDMLDYPADFPEGTTGTLLGGRVLQLFLGNHGADGLVVIDPASEPHLRRIALPFRRVDFALDPKLPTTGWVLTEDGSLHRIDLLAAEITGSAKVTGPYSMDGHWNDPRPRLALAGDEVLLTDPQAGLLRRISAATLQESGTIALEGVPYNLTVVGGSGLSH